MAKKWNNNNTREGASKLHRTVFAILKKQFPLSVIEQEFAITVVDDRGIKNTLYLDLFVPQFRIAIECQGRQHFERVGFFQSSNGDGFKKQKQNDDLKKEWCEANDVTLIELRFDEDVTDEVLLKKIGEALK